MRNQRHTKVYQPLSGEQQTRLLPVKLQDIEKYFVSWCAPEIAIETKLQGRSLKQTTIFSNQSLIANLLP
jgi:hypothetical protein